MPVSFCKRLVSSRLAQSPWQSLEKLISSGSVLIFTRCINSFQAFAALRDGHITSDPAIESRRSLYTTTIFPTLAKAGVASATLTLAWDFTVMSTTAQTGRMMSMREDAFARTSGGIDYVVVKKTDKPQRNVARRIDGEMRAPWYLNQGEAGQGARLVLDPTNPNRAVNNGEKWIPFVVMIPEAVANGSVVGHPMSYGHGLFGDRTEIFEDFLVEEANTYGYVVFATDWLGMCKEDEVALALMISESLTNFAMVPDRLHQGMLNALLMMRLGSSAVFAADPVMQPLGIRTINSTQRFYFGNSLGGIMGTVYMALSTDVTRGVIVVGGAPFSLLLPRSNDFTPLFDVLKLR
eukprot:m.176595 g.176595  ORF g.176595 m.176595 type:complete len:350 (+) comp21388_c0_seq8:572-1621(+)